MLHSRTWAVQETNNDPIRLAIWLTEQSWCLCDGFRLGDYLFLNDQTSEDGIKEFGVIHEPSMRQVDSVTIEWMDMSRALEFINRCINGSLEPITGKLSLRIETPEQHRCCHCE